MKILVTGASGFVGGAFMRRFSSRPGLTLHGIARRAVDLPNYQRIDLTRPFDLPFEPDVVIHAAARASPWGTRRQYHEQNVVATRNVVDFCEKKGKPRLVYISSTAVFYREEHQFDLTETSPIGPRFVNEYAATKYRGETVVQSYRGESLILRPRAVFGPGDTVLFPRVLAAARKGVLPLFVGQTQPVMGDLIYIDTLCDYLPDAAQRAQVAESYNLTNGRPVEIQRLLLDVLDRLGVPRPKRQLSIASALRVATVLEWLYRLLRLSWRTADNALRNRRRLFEDLRPQSHASRPGSTERKPRRWDRTVHRLAASAVVDGYCGTESVVMSSA